MPQQRTDPVQDHVDAIYDLMEYIGNRCPHQYDSDMEEKLRQIHDTLGRCKLEEKHWLQLPVRLRDSHAHNYMVAQCSILLVFANSVAQLAAQPGMELLRQKIAKLRNRTDEQFRIFYPDKELGA